MATKRRAFTAEEVKAAAGLSKLNPKSRAKAQEQLAHVAQAQEHLRLVNWAKRFLSSGPEIRALKALAERKVTHAGN